MSDSSDHFVLAAVHEIEAGIGRALAKEGIEIGLSTHGSGVKALNHVLCYPELIAAMEEISRMDGPAGKKAKETLTGLRERQSRLSFSYDARIRTAIDLLCQRGDLKGGESLPVHINHGSKCPMGKPNGKGPCVCLPDITITDFKGRRWHVSPNGKPVTEGNPGN